MNQNANAKMVTKLLFRLLPIQILLAAISAVNGIVSSLFASNYIGTEAMGAVALYAPLNLFIIDAEARTRQSDNKKRYRQKQTQRFERRAAAGQFGRQTLLSVLIDKPVQCLFAAAIGIIRQSDDYRLKPN